MTLAFESGKVLEHPQLNALVAALAGDGVLSGFEVAERGAGANMSVDVPLGEARISDTIESESGTTNLSIDASHATLERKDLITYDASANTPAVIKGVNHAGTLVDPTYPPSTPDGDILLAMVKVNAGATTITTGDITDGRVIIEDGYRYSGTNVYSTTAPTTWTDLDLSSVVGANRAVVLLKVENTGTSGAARYAFRPNGDTGDYSHTTYDTPSNFSLYDESASLVTVLTDESAIIEWMASFSRDTDITVMAYKKLLV